jgi:hypothetical protein
MRRICSKKRMSPSLPIKTFCPTRAIVRMSSNQLMKWDSCPQDPSDGIQEMTWIRRTGITRTSILTKRLLVTKKCSESLRNRKRRSKTLLVTSPKISCMRKPPTTSGVKRMLSTLRSLENTKRCQSLGTWTLGTASRIGVSSMIQIPSQ